MELKKRKKDMVISAIMAWMMLLTNSTLAIAPSLPNPVLVLIGTEQYEANGKQWTRYKYTVANRADYPDELFVASPDLPPCGRNSKASRTWIDFYDFVLSKVMMILVNYGLL
jgi:hypothetical protein